MPLTEQQIQIACNWWINAFIKPKFDNGANDRGNQMAAMLAARAVQPVTEHQNQTFKELLTKGLKEDPRGYTDLASDYNPTAFLGRIMEKAGISLNNCPWKTYMVFKDGKVFVAYGYGQPLVEVTE